MEIKISSLKHLEATPQSKENINSVIKSIQNESNKEKEYRMHLGSYEEAPKF